MKKREFVGGLLILLGITTLGSFAYPLARFLAPPRRRAKLKEITLKKSEIPAGEAKEIPLGGIPAIIINRPATGFIAFSRVCSHLGCLVDFNRTQNKIICPCHGAIFDLEGNVISGPPPKPLQRLPLRVEGETILVG